MNRPLPNMLFFSALLGLAACAGSAPQAPRTAAAPPDTVRQPAATGTALALPAEDVSRYRPTFAAPAVAAKPTVSTPPAPKAPVPPTNQVNAQMEQRLRDQGYTNQNVKYTQGYRILAYLGIEREQAMAIRRAVISRYPDETDYLVFKAPVYRLYIGDYTTKLEAARGLARVRPLTQKVELESMPVLLNKTQ